LLQISVETKKRYRDIITHVEGRRDQKKEIFLFALSTCIWCRMGKKWLNDRGYAYSYLDIDKIPVEEKNQIRNELVKLVGETPSFPFLVIDDEKWHSGYVSFIWEELLDES
jgi:glutaredoxin-like protein NrdH